MLARLARSAVALACGLLLVTAAPASAQTRQADAVLLARTLADGYTAIDARRPQALDTVGGWLAAQGRCAEPARLRSRSSRATFTAARGAALHAVALRALAPDLEALTARLRALPVTDPAIRGGVREILLDYRNAREIAESDPLGLCTVLRRLRAGAPVRLDIVPGEDVRRSGRALERRETRLRAAQRALLAVEVDPRLARSLDSVFEHATAGLYRSRLQARERLAPPFAIVTDAAGLARLRAEAASAAAAADTLVASLRQVGHRLRQASRRIVRCRPAIMEGVKRRPRGAFNLLTGWFFGELAAATERPVERFLAALEAAQVIDPALRDLLARASEQVAWIPGQPRVNICSKLRAWRRAGWRRGSVDVGPDPLEGAFGGLVYGIRLDDEQIDRAVLRRRGVSRAAANALVSPLGTLLESLETDPSTRTRARATSAATGDVLKSLDDVLRLAR